MGSGQQQREVSSKKTEGQGRGREKQAWWYKTGTQQRAWYKGGERPAGGQAGGLAWSVQLWCWEGPGTNAALGAPGALVGRSCMVQCCAAGRGCGCGGHVSK